MKGIITVVGKDKVGTIAGVAVYLASRNINILDVSQTIVQGYFTMLMIVDLSGADISFGTVQSELDEVGKKLGHIIKLQNEEIFDTMQRL